jgi:hypothetical protein
MNTYIPNKEINEWVEENREVIFSDIVKAIDGVASGKDDFPAIVCKIRTHTGVLDFLVNEENVLDSLRKAEMWFVTEEIYEKAAKARDLQKIYTKKQAV